MATPRFSAVLLQVVCRLAAVGLLLLLASAPAGAQVRRVTLGVHTTCPYGLMA